MAQKAYSRSYKSKETSQCLIANSGHHETPAPKETLYHLIGPYMKFSLMKDKMQRNRLCPSEIPEEGRRGRCTTLGQFAQERLTQAILQQTDLRMWQNKNLLLFNCRCLGEDLQIHLTSKVIMCGQ